MHVTLNCHNVSVLGPLNVLTSAGNGMTSYVVNTGLTFLFHSSAIKNPSVTIYVQLFSCTGSCIITFSTSYFSKVRPISNTIAPLVGSNT